MENFNKKILLCFTLIFLLCLSISSIYAEELNEDSSNICANSDLSDLEISDTQDIEEVPLEESSNGELEKNNDVISEENLQSSDIVEDEKQSMEVDNSKDENILTSSNLQSSDSEDEYEIENMYPEVWLEKAPSEQPVVLTSISKYSNTKVKFYIGLSEYYYGYDGIVTLRFNGKTYSAKIYDGEAVIIARTPSKIGKYKAILKYKGHTSYEDYGEYIYNPASSKFTLYVKKCRTIVSAPKVTAKHKRSKYFKIKVKNKATKESVKKVKLIVKVYTGKKYKTYRVKTNSKGIAKINTKRLSVGKHKVVIRSGNKNYIIKKTSKIVIKKPKAKSRKRSSLKSLVLKVRDGKYYYKNVGHGDTISSHYHTMYYGQCDGYRHVHLDVYGDGIEPNYYKIVKAKVYYNYYGSIRTRTYKADKWGYYISKTAPAGYEPYKAKIWYKPQ